MFVFDAVLADSDTFRARRFVQLVAMTVAPELFTPANARSALNIVGSVLVGFECSECDAQDCDVPLALLPACAHGLRPSKCAQDTSTGALPVSPPLRQLGVKTLDPADWNYHGAYDNSVDAPIASRKTARGFNYHNGPEWVWPYGYFLRARITFPPMLWKAQAHDPTSLSATRQRFVARALGPHRRHLQTSPWAGLPELTNEGGSHCQFSCEVQAWSSSTLLDVLYDANVYEAQRFEGF